MGNRFDPDNFDPQTFTRCARKDVEVGQTRTLQCESPSFGRYVTLYLGSWGSLAICDLKVHGHPLGKRAYNYNESVYLNLVKFKFNEALPCVLIRRVVRKNNTNFQD